MKKFLSFIFVGVFIFLGCSQNYEKSTKNHISVSGNAPKKSVMFFDDFYSAMIMASEKKDLDKSFSFYSTNFPANLEKVKENTKKMYENYKDIIYVPESIALNIKADSAITSDTYTFSALPIKIKEYKPMNYSGKERIYWKKEGDTWKIINWIYY